MRRARAFFYVCAGIILLARVSPLGAASLPVSPKGAPQRAAAPAASVRELQRAQAAVDSELVEAKASSDKYVAGVVKTLIEQRIEILKTTRALLVQRIVALQTGAPMTTRTVVARPDSAGARRLESEAQSVQRQIIEKQAESERYSGGLIKTTIEQNIAMLGVTLATLESERLKAIYGIVSPRGASATQPASEQSVSTKSATRSTSASKPAKDAAAFRMMVPTLVNKRFQDSNAHAGIYDDAMYFDVDWNTGGLPRPIRAVKGVLIVSDLFGEPKLSIQWTINSPLTPGEPYHETGVGFDYNQFINEHQWMRSTDLSDMTFKFRAESIIYQDGTKEDFSR
jgi:hypothetical protein